MTTPLMRLPGFQWGNAGKIDMSPINSAIDFHAKQRQQGVENERSNALLKLQQDRMGMERQKYEMDRNKQTVQEVGRLAQLALDEKDPARQGAVMQRIYGMHPTISQKLTSAGYDLNDAPGVAKFLQAQAGLYDPMAREERQLGMDAKRAQIRSLDRREEPEIVRTLHAGGIDPTSPQGQKIIRNSIKGAGPIDEAIAGMLKGVMPGQIVPGQSPQPQAGGMQPMSAPGSDPNLIRTQTATQPQPSNPGSMFANMPPEQKRRLAEAFLLSPRTKALGEQMIKDIDKENIDAVTRRNIEEKELAASETLANLQSIKQQFKPEFQTIPFKFKMSIAALQEKLSTDPNSIDPKTKQQLIEYSQYRVSAFQAMNAYIKAITGAQMSEAEAKRIRRGIPDPGDEMLNGDSPTELKAKLDRVIKDTKMAMMRYSYARASGRTWQSIPLEAMRGIIDKRGDQLFNEMRGSGLPEPQIRERVRMRLRQEFGGEA